MKSYPSIAKLPSLGPAHIFDKLDGSNLRFEWARVSRKNGSWRKFGTRTRLFDRSDEVFGPAIDIFLAQHAPALERMALDERWESVIFFAEFWGANSFAGLHDPTDTKHLSVFDIAPYKKGLLGPKDYLNLVERYTVEDTPRYLGVQNWTPGFVERVRLGEVEGVTFEGVVGKVGSGHALQMSKAKTQAWIDKVRALHPAEADTILMS